MGGDAVSQRPPKARAGRPAAAGSRPQAAGPGGCSGLCGRLRPEPLIWVRLQASLFGEGRLIVGRSRRSEASLYVETMLGLRKK
eukprot:877492-Prorocentrum_minimum.AAC.1